MTPVRLEPTVPRSRVKQFSIAVDIMQLLCTLGYTCDVGRNYSDMPQPRIENGALDRKTYTLWSYILATFYHNAVQKVGENDQEIPQSHTADQPTVYKYTYLGTVPTIFEYLSIVHEFIYYLSAFPSG